MIYYADNHRCQNCGCRYGDHVNGGKNCPPLNGWGNPKPFPKPPRVHTQAGLDGFHARIDAYVAKAVGEFKPR